MKTKDLRDILTSKEVNYYSVDDQIIQLNDWYNKKMLLENNMNISNTIYDVKNNIDELLDLKDYIILNLKNILNISDFFYNNKPVTKSFRLKWWITVSKLVEYMKMHLLDFHFIYNNWESTDLLTMHELRVHLQLIWVFEIKFLILWYQNLR